MTPESSMDYDLIQRLQQIEKGNTEPTIKISVFREALVGYCISLRVRFTSACPHYQGCFEIKRIIDGWDETEREEVLTALHLLILQWRIEEDFYMYCAQKMTKADLQQFSP